MAFVPLSFPNNSHNLFQRLTRKESKMDLNCNYQQNPNSSNLEPVPNLMPDTLTGTFPFLKIRDDTLATRNLTQECKIFFAFSKGKKSSSKISEKNIEMFNLCT